MGRSLNQKRRGPFTWLSQRSRQFWFRAALVLLVLYCASFVAVVRFAAGMHGVLLDVLVVLYFPLLKAFGWE